MEEASLMMGNCLNLADDLVRLVRCINFESLKSQFILWAIGRKCKPWIKSNCDVLCIKCKCKCDVERNKIILV